MYQHDSKAVAKAKATLQHIRLKAKRKQAWLSGDTPKVSRLTMAIHRTAIYMKGL